LFDASRTPRRVVIVLLIVVLLFCKLNNGLAVEKRHGRPPVLVGGELAVAVLMAGTNRCCQQGRDSIIVADDVISVVRSVDIGG
jgi:hypothetical protein